MKFIDRLGYILLFLSSLYVLILYLNIILYEADFLLFGNYEELRLNSVFEHSKDKSIYVFNSQHNDCLYSLPTAIKINIGESYKVRTVPHFKKILFGSFSIFLFSVLFVTVLIMVLLALISIFKLTQSCRKFSKVEH
jgi:hypothetical protein